MPKYTTTDRGDACLTCGALVADQSLHTAWHFRNGEPEALGGAVFPEE